MLEIVFTVLFCATVLVAPIAWLRMLRAKTQRDYLLNTALFVLPIFATFGLGHLTGVIDFTTPHETELPLKSASQSLSWVQVFLLSAAGCLWVIGVNVLMYRHTRRMERPFWSILNPFKPQFRDFSRREWASLVVLAMVSLLLGALAINFAPA